MKISLLSSVFFICVYLNVVYSKSLKIHFDNSINTFKDQNKPFAGSVGNTISESYARTKRELCQPSRDLQKGLTNAKMECAREMNIIPEVMQKSLMNEDKPTRDEQCLMRCLLKKTKLMDDSNKLSLSTLGSIAAAISDNNPLVESVTVAAADNCNRSIRAVEPCESAFQINKCIAKELKATKLKIYY